MIRYMAECTCKPGVPYADGTLPVFYVDDPALANKDLKIFVGDAQKAAYLHWKLKDKAREGMRQSHKELVILPNETAPDAVAFQGVKPLANLQDYNLYFGVHFQGLHVMKP